MSDDASQSGLRVLNQTPPSARSHKGLIWVYLNGRCNFTCSYCLDGRNSIPGALASHDNYVERLSALQKELGFSLILTGGEPFLSLDAIKDICRTFISVPIGIQTNGALTTRIASIVPFLKHSDWISISFHDETLGEARKLAAVNGTIQLLLDAGIPVHTQFMCSPSNVIQMLSQAWIQREKGCRTSIRRLFEHPAEVFLPWQSQIAKASSDNWAEQAFFGSPLSVTQPFAAAVVYLDGRVAYVCREEVTIGNLFSGYDLSLVEPHRAKWCDSTCHCCSCLWVDQEWGFA